MFRKNHHNITAKGLQKGLSLRDHKAEDMSIILRSLVKKKLLTVNIAHSVCKIIIALSACAKIIVNLLVSN